jgi:hypothetical protein
MSFAFYLLMSIMIFLFLCACTNLWIRLMHLSSGEEENAELAAKNWWSFKSCNWVSRSKLSWRQHWTFCWVKIKPTKQQKMVCYLFGGNFTGAKLCSGCGSFDVVWWYMVIHVGVLICLWLWWYMLYTYKKYSDDIYWFGDLGWPGIIW